MTKDENIININTILPLSFANGPGRRTVIWLQGCDLRCPGCFNPDTHQTDPRDLMGVKDIYKRILSNLGTVEGITISGGEPFQQAEPLLSLLRRVRLETSLSVLVFSGYTKSQIKNLRYGEELLMNIDVLVAGPYVAPLRSGENLCGSSNQKMHMLTDRYCIEDIVDLPSAEVQIDAKGNIHITGFPVMKAAEIQSSLS